MKPLRLLLLIIFFCSKAVAQKSADRIYVHTDRQIYFASETIWFKAYLYLQFAPNDVSSNLSVELTDDKGKQISLKRLPVIDGTAAGNFDLPNDIRSGQYYIRAWKRSDTSIQTYSTVFIYGAADPVFPERRYQVNFAASTVHLIPDIANTIHYSVLSNYNTSETAEIKIRDDAGKVAETINTKTGAASSFTFVPKSGKRYTASLHFAGGTDINAHLPVVDNSGTTVEIIQSESDLRISVEPLGVKPAAAILYAVMGSSVLIEKKIDTEKKQSLKLSTADLPEGLLEVMIIADNKLIGFARTLIERTASPFIQTEINRTDSQTTYSLRFPDLVGTFSVSAVKLNESVTPVGDNIKTSLLSAYSGISDTKELAHYLNSISPNADAIKINSSMIYDTSYISVSGQLIEKKSAKPISVSELTLFMQTKDSTNSMMVPAVDANGRFRLDHLFFYDSARFAFKTSSSKTLDIIVGQDATDRPIFAPPLFTFDPELIRQQKALAADKLKRIDTFYNAADLNAVTVKSYLGTKKEQVNRRYTSGVFVSSGMARVVDLINNPPVNGGMNIFDYLQGQIADLLITRIDGATYSLTSSRTISITGGAAQIKLYLNEYEVTSEVMLGIRVKEIAMVKYYPPGYAPISGVGGAGVLAIYTKKNEDAYNIIPSAFTGAFTVPGFSRTKDFIAGNYSGTLHWNPNVIINKAITSYSFALKQPQDMRIVVEGYTAEGELIHYETVVKK